MFMFPLAHNLLNEREWYEQRKQNKHPYMYIVHCSTTNQKKNRKKKEAIPGYGVHIQIVLQWWNVYEWNAATTFADTHSMYMWKDRMKGTALEKKISLIIKTPVTQHQQRKMNTLNFCRWFPGIQSPRFGRHFFEDILFLLLCFLVPLNLCLI